jgi:putative oxidoreductase
MASTTSVSRDLGLLIVRLGVGLSFVIFHGYDKMAGGSELWAKVGGAMGHLGIHFAPAFWGFLAALSESVGAALIVLGVFFRPAAAFVAFTMLVAVLNHLNLPPDNPAAGWKGASHALELCSVSLGLLFLGPGQIALSSLWSKRSR